MRVLTFIFLLGALLLLPQSYAHSAESMRPIQFTGALAIPAATDEFPDKGLAMPVTLPDAWSQSRPNFQGSVWYRLTFDTPRGFSSNELVSIYIPRVCTNLEVFLNGHLIHSGGQMTPPASRNCYRSQLITLSPVVIKPKNNQLDIKVVGSALHSVSSRQREGYLSEIYIGPYTLLAEWSEQQIFWNINMSQIISGILIALGLFAILLAWVRNNIPYALYFGLTCLSWALLNARLWLQYLPWPSSLTEALTGAAFTPLVTFAILFLLRYSGRLDPRVQLWLWLQCLLLPIAFILAAPDHLFTLSITCYLFLTLELCAAFAVYLIRSWRAKRATFWLMTCMLLTAIILMLGEISVQLGLIDIPSLQLTNLILPIIFGIVGLRLLQLFVQMLQTAEDAKAELEIRVQEATEEIERNFGQLADLRAEQVAEQERKRIAGDLHDDLGAKLLTIVHMSNDEKISNLAREALEEMRLSVRGLTGKPVLLSDAVGDWRAETVMRLQQAGFEVEWIGDADGGVERRLNAREYVQTTRILREATNNIIKHSGASRCEISADLDAEDFRLVIRDNGKGIPKETNDLDRGHGMTSMKRRAKQIQGQCLVESGPGYGTVIRLTLPLRLHLTTVPEISTH
jgi:signal transduction histidine kinase